MLRGVDSHAEADTGCTCVYSLLANTHAHFPDTFFKPLLSLSQVKFVAFRESFCLRETEETSKTEKGGGTGLKSPISTDFGVCQSVVTNSPGVGERKKKEAPHVIEFFPHTLGMQPRFVI